MIKHANHFVCGASAAEELILSLFWEADEKNLPGFVVCFSIKEICASASVIERHWAYNTVASLLKRLERRGFVRRCEHRSGKSFCYHATLSYKEYRGMLAEAFELRYPL